MTGEARDIVDEREPVPCEFAIAAADRWCGVRLGCMLLERLVDRTVRSCIPRMSADTVATDKPKPPPAGRAGFARARKRERRLVHLVKELPAPDRCASRQRPAEIAGTA